MKLHSSNTNEARPGDVGPVLKSLPNLEYLHLECNFTEDNVLESLVAGTTWPTLRHLDMQGFILDTSQLIAFLSRHSQTITHLGLDILLDFDRHSWHLHPTDHDGRFLVMWTHFIRRPAILKKLKRFTIYHHSPEGYDTPLNGFIVLSEDEKPDLDDPRDKYRSALPYFLSGGDRNLTRRWDILTLPEREEALKATIEKEKSLWA